LRRLTLDYYGSLYVRLFLCCVASIAPSIDSLTYRTLSRTRTLNQPQHQPTHRILHSTTDRLAHRLHTSRLHACSIFDSSSSSTRHGSVRSTEVVAPTGHCESVATHTVMHGGTWQGTMQRGASYSHKSAAIVWVRVCACTVSIAELSKTGGAGNNTWYNPEVSQAAAQSRRPASASQRSGAQAQYRPASASLRYDEQQPRYGSSSSLAPTQQLQPRMLSARTMALPIAELHEESCICTVCTCGKHACPPTPRVNHYDPNMASESRQAYTGKFVPAKRAGAPDQYKPHDAPFEGISTHTASYPNHGPIAPRKSPPRSSMMDTGVGRNQTPFDDTTTHKSDYPAHPLAPRSSGGPKQGNLSTLGNDDRDFSTEGRTVYVPHPLQSRKSRAPEELRPSIPFQGVSTNKSDFPHHVNARPSIPKFRSSGFQPNPEDRDFATENRGNFIPMTIETCPAIPVAVLTKNRPGHVQVELTPGTHTYRRKPTY
jgi:hypothetical protein